MAQTPNPWTARLDPRLAYRVWMTGSIAVVMATLWTLRGLPDEEKQKRLLRYSSPYSVSETVLRIEASAAERGLHVLLRDARGTSPVIVLASSAGGTPVLMGARGLRNVVPAMPMALQVRSAGATSEVLLADASSLLERVSGDLPAAVAAEVASLPSLLDRALSASPAARG
jgi:hypothetical protein